MYLMLLVHMHVVRYNMHMRCVLLCVDTVSIHVLFWRRGVAVHTHVTQGVMRMHCVLPGRRGCLKARFEQPVRRVTRFRSGEDQTLLLSSAVVERRRRKKKTNGNNAGQRLSFCCLLDREDPALFVCQS